MNLDGNQTLGGDGEIRFRGRVDELLLRRLIEGTQPHTES